MTKSENKHFSVLFQSNCLKSRYRLWLMWQLYNHLHLLQFSFISAKNCYLESQISCIVLQVTELSKSHCISHCGGGFTHPENCIQRLLGSLENFPLISRGSDFVKKINKEKKLEVTLIKIRESRPLMWLFAVPQLKVLTFPIAFPALFLAVATAFCNKINKPNLAATNSSLQVLTLPYPGLARSWCWVRFFSGCCCPDWCWVPGVTGQ